MSEPTSATTIPRLDRPPEGQTVKGWCLYGDDRWNGPTPQDWDELGWWVYPDRESSFLGLARELRKRCDLFDAGLLRGPELACAWYPVEVTYRSDGYVTDETTSTFAPGEPW